MTETSRFVHKFNLILTHSDEISIYCGEKDSSIWSVRAHQDPLDCFGSWFICWNRSWRARRMMRFGAQRRCGVWTFDVTCMILWHSWQIQFKGVGVVPPHHTSRLGCGDQVKIWIREQTSSILWLFWSLWEREILGQSKKLHMDLGPWPIGGCGYWINLNGDIFFSLKSDSWEHFLVLCLPVAQQVYCSSVGGALEIVTRSFWTTKSSLLSVRN